jgi:hypothetical protein
MIRNGNRPMANDSGAPDWAKAEIAEAIRILKEDGLHIHRTYDAFMKTKEAPTDPPKSEDDDTEGKPPPAKDAPTDKPGRKSLWWGDRS